MCMTVTNKFTLLTSCDTQSRAGNYSKLDWKQLCQSGLHFIHFIKNFYYDDCRTKRFLVKNVKDWNWKNDNTYYMCLSPQTNNQSLLAGKAITMADQRNADINSN